MSQPRDDERREASEDTKASATLPTRVVAGKYRLGRLLGEGGMGAVYEAEHLELGIKVAVKLLNPAIAVSPRAITRFRREARATASLRHENIVHVTDAGADKLGPYLVMELLEGESLSSLLHRERALDPHLAVGITLQILSGLAVAHDAKIVHRDLKPGNILVSMEGGTLRVTILDFGISKLSEPDLTGVTTTGDLVGTPRFMAPEQARGQLDIDTRADLYAVGVMLYLMLTGRAPHRGASSDEIIRHVLEGRVVPPRELMPGLSEDLERVILKAMAADREARFADAREFIDALRACIPEEAGVPAAPPAGVPTPPPARVPTPVAARVPTPAAARVPSPAARSRRRLLRLLWLSPLVAGALVAAGWLALRQPAGAVVAPGPVLRFGIARYNSDAAIRSQLGPVVAYLERRLRRKVDLEIVDYGVDPGAKLVAGEFDVAALSPYLYVRAKERAPGLRVLATPITAGGASYEGLILARAGSGIRKLEDLRGKVFCYVEESSTSGYLYPRALFRRHGLDPDHLFSSVRFAGTHASALRELASGTCDGAAVYASILDDRSVGLPRDRFVTLEATPRIPYDAYCVTDRMPRAVADALQAALLALAPGSPAARHVFGKSSVITGFGPAADDDYDRVRAISKYLER